MSAEPQIVLLPPVYAGWVRELLGGDIPAESAAVCDPCAMCQGSGLATGESFNPKTKCCTFRPSLPNFLVGGVLADQSPGATAGRELIARQIEDGLAVSPYEVGKPARYRLLWHHGEAGYGHSEALVCPFLLEGGRCGVWAHREATCATWFCKYERGAVGRRFWRSLQQLLATVEHSLSLWCALELGVEAGGLGRAFATDPSFALDAAQLDLVADERTRRAEWGHWRGREADYFEACRLRVAPLSWSDVLTLGGVELRAKVVLVRSAYQELLTPSLPERLELGSWQLLSCSEDSVRVVSYSPYDALELPREILEVLPFFDGRTVEAARRSAKQNGFELDDELLQMLVDFELLRVC